MSTCACTLCAHSETSFSSLLVDPSLSKNQWKNTLLFLFVGLGISVTWNSISFSMAFFTNFYSDYSLSWTLLLLAYNLPGLPVQILKLFTSQDKLLLFKSSIICYILLCIMIICIPFIFILISNVPITFLLMLCLSFFIGFIQASLFSIVLQLTGYFGSSSAPSCFGGIGISTCILLLLSLTENYDASSATNLDLVLYYVPLTVFPLLSSLAIILLYVHDKKKEHENWIELEQLEPEDDEINNDSIFEEEEETKECKCCTKAKEETNEELDGDNQSDEESSHCACTCNEDSACCEDNSFLSKLNLVKYSCIASFIIGFDLVFLSARVPSLNVDNNGEFDAIVMYIQAICLFIGNESAVFFKLSKTIQSLIIFVLFQAFLLVPINFHNLYSTYDSANIILFSLVGLYSLLGAHLNSCSYVLASNSTNSTTSKQKAISIGFVNICLYFGYLLAIIFNISVEILKEI